jgi:electron transport complex protein RnfG
MRKSKIAPVITLTVICICVALALAVANAFTSPVIEKAQAEKTAKLLRKVYPMADSFEPIEPDGIKGLPESITEIYGAPDGGFVFKSKVKGFKPDLVVLVGVDPAGAVTDTKYLQSGETLSAEDKLDGAYKGVSSDGFQPEIIGGATYTSEGYAQAVTDSLLAFDVMKGVGK